jgi:hypothetical protein
MKREIKKRHSRARGIAETYIHIKDLPGSLNKESARIYLNEHIYSLAEQHFKGKVYLEVTIEDGSIIARVKVGGQALMILLATYGGIRAGIDYLVDDSYQFSDTIIERFIEDENIPDQAIIRVERRLGVPGKIQRFYKKLDKLNSHDRSHNQKKEAIDELKEELISIIELLESDKDREVFLSELPEYITPDPDSPLPEPIRGAITFNIYRNEEDEQNI